MVWDNRHFETLERVVAIEIKTLAGRPVAFYYYSGDKPSGKVKRENVRLVLEREPEMDIRTFIVWARGAAEAMGFFSVLGLHRTS